MLGAWGLSLTRACSSLPFPGDFTFYLPRPSQIPLVNAHAKKAPLFRKIKTHPKYIYNKAFAVWEFPCVGCALKSAEMLSWSKTLFINFLSALKPFKSWGLLHNPTFWSWECGKVLPWFFVGFSLILNFDFLSWCVVCDCFIPLYNCCFLSPK